VDWYEWLVETQIEDMILSRQKRKVPEIDEYKKSVEDKLLEEVNNE
jgi:hypothetical protein